MYSSRATELGRGPKLGRLTDAPEWTPAPNAYTMKSDFVNQKKENEMKLVRIDATQMAATSMPEEDPPLAQQPDETTVQQSQPQETRKTEETQDGEAM